MRKEYTPEMNVVIAAYKNNERVAGYILVKALAAASEIFGLAGIHNAWSAMVKNSNADWNNIVYRQMRAIAEVDCIGF